MKYRKSRYTPHFKLRVLAAFDAGGRRRWRRLEAEFDVPYRTILDWHRHREQIIEQAEAERSPGRAAVNAHFNMLIQQVLNTLPEKIAGAKLTDSLRALEMINELRHRFTQLAPDEIDMDSVYERLSENINRYRHLHPELEVHQTDQTALTVLEE